MNRIVLLFIFSFIYLTAIQNVLAEENIPFTERNGLKYITVRINNLPIDLVFDTGATNIVLNSDALQRLGITRFKETRKIISHTAGGVVEGYIFKLSNISAGNIYKMDYDAAYVPASTENLLGASFFENYSYYIDEDYKVIRLVPKGKYFFDRLDRPAITPRSNDTGHIEIEIDGEKYIHDGKKLKLQ